MKKKDLYLKSKYKLKYKKLLKDFIFLKKKWNIFLHKKRYFNNFLMLRHFFFNNNEDFSKIINLMKKEMRNRLKIYKLIYISYKILNDLNLEKKKKIYSFKNLKTFDSILDQLKLYVKKRKDFFDLRKKSLEGCFNLKWFRVLYRKKFLLKHTQNFNRLYLLQFLNKEKKRINKQKKKRLKSCLMILKKNNNNFFVILSTFGGKVITYRWAGQFNESHSIKNKRSYYLIFPLMKHIFKILKKFKVNNLVIKIRSNITPHMRKIIQLIQSRRIKISKIYFRKPIPHHLGNRKKKLRRI